MGLLRARRVLYIFLGLYAVTLIALIPAKPLWMDEIIDLGGVRNADFRGVLDFAPRNAGGVPLGYLTDWAMIRMFGYSVFIVRLPSVLFTVLTCAGVYLLVRQTRLRAPLLAAILYAVSPLTVRYALEARPYAQATCWSVFSTVAFLALIRRPAPWKAAAYAVVATAGLFTQPYSIFVPVAHLIWLVLTGSVKEKARASSLAAAAVALAGLAFVPWFLKTQGAWQGAVNSGVRFLVTARDLLVIPHELMGTGYAGTAATVIAIAVALGWTSWNKQEKSFWTTWALVPLFLIPSADAYFGYFLAARQLIFVLVPISVLIVACAEVRRWGFLIPVALILAMVYEDIRWMRRPGDGWQAAAAQLSEQTSEPGSCAMLVPEGARTMYVFFAPRLEICAESTLGSVSKVALALSPDQYESVYADARQKLDRAGFHKVSEVRVANPRIELYRR